MEKEFADYFEQTLCARVRDFVCDLLLRFSLNKQVTVLKKKLNVKIVSIDAVFEKILTDWTFLKNKYSDLFQEDFSFFLTPFVQKLLYYPCLQLQSFHCIDKDKKDAIENIYSDFSKNFQTILSRNEQIVCIDGFLETLLTALKSSA